MMYFIGMADAVGKSQSFWAQGPHIRLDKISASFKLRTLAEEVLHLL